MELLVPALHSSQEQAGAAGRIDEVLESGHETGCHLGWDHSSAPSGPCIVRFCAVFYGAGVEGSL